MHTQEPRHNQPAQNTPPASGAPASKEAESDAARARAHANPRDEQEGRLPTDARARSYDRPAAEIQVAFKGHDHKSKGKHPSLAGGVAWHLSDATKAEITHDPQDDSHAYLRALTDVGEITVTATSGDIRGEKTFKMDEITSAAKSEKALVVTVEAPL